MRTLYVVLAVVSDVAGIVFLLAAIYQVGSKMLREGRIERLPRMTLPEIPGRYFFSLMFVTLLLFVSRFWSGSVADRDLKSEALELASELISFADRRSALPEPQPREGPQAYNLRAERYTIETQSEYSRIYLARVEHVRHEFARRELTDKDLDFHYRYPTEVKAIRTIGERLLVLAARLGW